MKVCVLSKEGKPLMPTTPRRARVWLEAKRARVVRRDPFTIRLRFTTQEYVQPARVGVDTGSKDVGIAATTNGEVVFQAEVHLRDDITEKLRQRRKSSNSASNLTLACRPCNQRKGQQTAAEFGFTDVQAKARIPLLDAAHVTSLKGAFVIKDVISGKKLVEVTPHKLERLVRPTQGWMNTRLPVLESIRKESGASSST